MTRALVRRGYREPQIAGSWSGNVLRVLAVVQAVARKLQAAKSPKRPHAGSVRRIQRGTPLPCSRI